MTDPVTLSAVAIGSMGMKIAGGLVSAAGQIYSGKAAAQMAQYQAGVDEYNRQVKLQDAEYQYQVGDVEAQQAGMKQRFVIGQTRAAQAASGLDITRGTSTNVIKAELDVGAQQQGIIRANAARRAYGDQIEAQKYQMQEGLHMMEAENAITSSHYNALASILGGASSTASDYMKYSDTFGKVFG